MELYSSRALCKHSCFRLNMQKNNKLFVMELRISNASQEAEPYSCMRVVILKPLAAEVILRDNREQTPPPELAYLVSNFSLLGSLYDTKWSYATTQMVNNAEPELHGQRGLNYKGCAPKLHWNVSALFHQRGNDLNSYATSFQATNGLTHPFVPFCPFPHFHLSPSLKGVTTHQVINHRLQRQHKEANSRKETEGGRMCQVYITYTTPPGDSRGREWTNKAGMNYCICILQNIKSWSHLKREPHGAFWYYTLWFDM